jgi:hypothetical protein
MANSSKLNRRIMEMKKFVGRYSTFVRFQCRASFGVVFILLFTLSLGAQKDLKLIEDEATSLLSGLTGSGSNKIERATLTKEDERSVTVSLRFAGFADKEYKIQVAILNRSKEVMEEITPVEMDMPKSKQADVSMSIIDSGKAMSQSSLESKFLRIRVGPKEGGIAGVLGDTFDDINLSATEFLFELNKKWMVMGPAVKVNVALTPYKSAASIPQ